MNDLLNPCDISRISFSRYRCRYFETLSHSSSLVSFFSKKSRDVGKRTFHFSVMTDLLCTIDILCNRTSNKMTTYWQNSRIHTTIDLKKWLTSVTPNLALSQETEHSDNDSEVLDHVKYDLFLYLKSKFVTTNTWWSQQRRSSSGRLENLAWIVSDGIESEKDAEIIFK